MISDNKLAENAGWDMELLTLKLKEILPNFDITLTGFEMLEVDLLLGELDGSGSDAADEIPEGDAKLPPVSRLGDLWRIGEHFLLCGDSTKRESYEALLRGAKVQAVFTDSPYNVRMSRFRRAPRRLRKLACSTSSCERNRNRHHRKYRLLDNAKILL